MESTTDVLIQDCDGYQCKMCKRSFAGAPSRKNGVGAFCEACSREISNRQRKPKRIATINGNLAHEVCVWCGDVLTDGNRRSHGDRDLSDNTCVVCDKNRGWLLRCIKISEKPAKYVASKEQKYGAIRKENAKRNKPAEVCHDDMRELERLVLAVNASFEKIRGRCL